jgi:cyclase
MRKLRIIPRLDIKGPNLIKGVHLEGLRIMGDPALFAHKYYQDGADEMIYMDSVASLYERNNILAIVKETAQQVFIPLTVGGGIRSTHDAQAALRSGADKVAVNTAAIKNPTLIREIAQDFGNQCMVLSIEAKRVNDKAWECYYDNGREKTDVDVVYWAQKAQDLGAGEILLTSVDQEGTKKGFDVELINAVLSHVQIPVIASGGMGSLDDLLTLTRETDIDAIAIANLLHYNQLSIREIHSALSAQGFEVRC